MADSDDEESIVEQVQVALVPDVSDEPGPSGEIGYEHYEHC